MCVCECDAVSVPGPLSPSDGLINVSTVPTFTWNSVTGASTYNVRACGNSTCSSVDVSSNVSISQWQVSPALDQGKTYWWQVSAKNSCGNSSSWSAARSITTICSSPLCTWHSRNLLDGGNALNGVAYGNNTFVAAGDSGTILASSDGVTWTTGGSGTTSYLMGGAYGSNTFVAVGGSGTIRTSTNNGVTWTTGNLRGGTTNALWGVAYGNNTFVAAGDSGTILTSANNGATWTLGTSGTTNALWGVAYGNNTFVAAGDSGTIRTSTNNRVTWTTGTTNYLMGVAYGNNTFVAVGDSGTILQTDPLPQYENFSLTLNSGWNLISFPLLSADTGIANVLSGISDNYTIVWEFTPPSTWKSYDPNDAVFSDLKTFTNDKGYWVKIKAAKALTISGTNPSKTISLALGWNLIGYTGTNEAAVGTALQSIAGKYTIVWEFTPPSTWKSYDPNDPDFSDLKTFISGKGYWIKTTEGVVWNQ
ncbi:MAG: hypothetical protein NTX36_10540 [Proteobacteria bacterium]|nr:hypothetical protein [Pseudomonadota bacterium]